MIKKKIEEILKKVIKEDVKIELVVPENKNFGHYSTNVALRLAHKKSGSPMKIADELLDKILKAAPKGFFSGASLGFEEEKKGIMAVEPGFINFWVSPKAIQKEFLEIYKKGEKWGQPLGKPRGRQTIVVDYCGVNIAKPMGVGHLRSTIIGQALYNILKFSGYKVIGDNHLGDWGKQFGVLIAAYKNRLKVKGYRLKNFTIEELMEMYVDYTARMKKNPELEKIAKEETKKLQNNDKENVKIWKEFHKITFAELNKIFNLLDIKIDKHLGERSYSSMLPKIIQDALNKKVAAKSQGAIVIFTDKNRPPFIIQKSDEAYLYSTTDIATIKRRIEKFKADQIVYVVGNEQNLYFEQLFKAVKMLGIVKNQKLAHIKFGLILSEDMKKLSTRAGKHISLLEVINEAIKRAKTIVDEKRPDLPEKERQKIAEVVGIGALKYNDLSQNRQSDISFNWDKMLSFEGNSAPYLQYTYARLRSVLRKARIFNFQFSIFNLREKEELGLILKLSEFPDVVQKITENYYPHYLAEYLYKLAQEANDFYHKIPVLKAEKGVKEARLALIDVISKILKTGLDLLGINVLEKM